MGTILSFSVAKLELDIFSQTNAFTTYVLIPKINLVSDLNKRKLDEAYIFYCI